MLSTEVPQVSYSIVCLSLTPLSITIDYLGLSERFHSGSLRSDEERAQGQQPLQIVHSAPSLHPRALQPAWEVRMASAAWNREAVRQLVSLDQPGSA